MPGIYVSAVFPKYRKMFGMAPESGAFLYMLWERVVKMKKESGFLLVELLVTLALLVLLVPPLLGLMQLGINTLYRAKRQTKALYLAVECLENLRTQHLCTLESTGDGPVADFPEYFSEVQVKELEQSQSNLPLKEICVQVRAESGPSIRLVTWQTWR